MGINLIKDINLEVIIMERKKLIKKINKLMYGEFFAAVSFVIAFNIYHKKFEFDFYLVDYLSITVLVLFLLEGSYFWFCIRNKYIKREKDYGLICLAFRDIKNLNIMLWLIPFFMNIFMQYHRPMNYLIFNWVVLAFAALEYINYFYVQLYYPPMEWFIRLRSLDFKESKLHLLMRKNKNTFNTYRIKDKIDIGNN